MHISPEERMAIAKQAIAMRDERLREARLANDLREQRIALRARWARPILAMHWLVVGYGGTVALGWVGGVVLVVVNATSPDVTTLIPEVTGSLSVGTALLGVLVSAIRKLEQRWELAAV